MQTSWPPMKWRSLNAREASKEDAPLRLFRRIAEVKREIWKGGGHRRLKGPQLHKESANPSSVELHINECRFRISWAKKGARGLNLVARKIQRVYAAPSLFAKGPVRVFGSWNEFLLRRSFNPFRYAIGHRPSFDACRLPGYPLCLNTCAGGPGTSSCQQDDLGVELCGTRGDGDRCATTVATP